MATQLRRLFEPYQMGKVSIANRIVLAGHGSRFVDPHAMLPVRRQAEYLAERARGGVGMIIQGSCIVHPTGLTVGGTHQLWNDDCIPAYAMLADAVHAHGVPLFGQLSHLGRNGNSYANQREQWAPSAIPEPAIRTVPHAITRAQIAEVVAAYRRAARRLLTAGFDGLEVYLAHGYLLCSFLSPLSNKRTDEYGGPLENRLRFPLEVLRAVRDEVGPDVPVGIRVSAEEFFPEGLHPDDAAEIVVRLREAVPIHYISVSQSNFSTIDHQIPDMGFPRTPFVEYAGLIRKYAGGVPVFTVARIVDPERAEELLENGTADFVAMVRPLIADPALPAKAKAGRLDEIRRCISCNVGCRGGPHRGLPISCLVNPVVGFESKWGGELPKASRSKRVAVIGGGPAGLKAAEIAAIRGHSVTLIEAGEILGGEVNVAARAMPYRDEFANATRFMESECRRLGVDIRLGQVADRSTIGALKPDVVFVATGGYAGRPNVPGIDLPFVRTAHDAIVDGYPTGRNVLVVDGGEADWKALTTAEGLAAAGNTVTLISPVPIGAEIDITSRIPLLRRLGAAGVMMREHAVLKEVREGVTVVRDVWSGIETEIAVDEVVLAWFGVANDTLFHELTEDGLDCRLIGDASAPRRAIDAVWDGFRVAMEL